TADSSLRLREQQRSFAPPVASSAASSKSDPDRPHRPGQREPPHSSVFVGESNSALSGGDFQGMGVFRSDEVWGRSREEFPRYLSVFDEPSDVIPPHVCLPAET